MNSNEANLIGALIGNPDKIDEVSASVSVEMFANPMLRDIYSLILQGKTNVVEIGQLLQDTYGTEVNNVLRDVMNDNLFSFSYLKEYVQAIRNAYRVREIKRIFTQKELTSATVNELLPQIIEQLENVTPIQRKVAKSLADLVEYNGNYFTEKPKGFELGLQALDDKISGIDKGDICIIAARPGIGKSAFALQVMKHNKDLKGGYFNLEMGEEQIYERALASASGIDLGHIRKATHFHNDEEIYFNQANEEIKQYTNIKIITQAVRISDIRNVCRTEKFDYIVIDYLQLIASDRNWGANRTAEVGDISRGLKAIARDFDMPVIALSQLNRRSEGTDDKEPTMADLRESGAIEQDASVIVIMWRTKDEPDKRNIKVEKARNGMPGKMQIYFDGSQMKFSEKPIPKRKSKIPEGFTALNDNDESPFT